MHYFKQITTTFDSQKNEVILYALDNFGVVYQFQNSAWIQLPMDMKNLQGLTIR